MRPLFIIILFLSTNGYSQVSSKFLEYTTSQIALHKESIEKFCIHFQKLFEKRDTAYLIDKLNNTKADIIYIIEGYNFATGKYGIFEEYKTADKRWWLDTSLVFLDKQRQTFPGNHGLYDTSVISVDTSFVDKILPRKYRYGAGCVVGKDCKKIFKRLRKKANKDGLVIEPYCRVETIIDKRTSKIQVKYFIPVAGQRECDLRIGLFSDWSEGLDFWLFVAPHIVDK